MRFAMRLFLMSVAFVVAIRPNFTCAIDSQQSSTEQSQTPANQNNQPPRSWQEFLMGCAFEAGKTIVATVCTAVVLKYLNQSTKPTPEEKDQRVRADTQQEVAYWQDMHDRCVVLNKPKHECDELDQAYKLSFKKYMELLQK